MGYFLPLLASSSHCFVIRRYLGDSGHTGSRISCRIAGKMAKPAINQNVLTLGSKRNTRLIFGWAILAVACMDEHKAFHCYWSTNCGLWKISKP